MKKIIRALASIKFAVVYMVLIAVITAIGTIVESKYNAGLAKKWVYNTWWMYLVLGCFAVNLTAVILDRYPWKRHHSAFIAAHIGILMILAGAILTLLFGIDGSLRIPLNSKGRYVTVAEHEINVYTSFDGDNYSNTFNQPIDFFKIDLIKKPLSIPTIDGEIKITEHIPFALGQRNIIPVPINPEAKNTIQQGLPAIRFQLDGPFPQAKAVEWLILPKKNTPAKLELGLATFELQSLAENHKSKTALPHLKQPTDAKNEFIFISSGTNLFYAINYQNKAKKPVLGALQPGVWIETGWMGLKLRVLEYIPFAQEKWTFKSLEYPTTKTTEAIKIEFDGKTEWVQAGDVMKLASKNSLSVFSFGPRRIDLGFDIQLENFKIDNYQGTQRAAAYESEVKILKDSSVHTISMNEPLKYAGFTFYQASFETDPKTGKPTSSIFSVNADPGRFLKYLGSLVMSIGVILLFYYRKVIIPRK